MGNAWDVLIDATSELDDDTRPRFINWLSNDALPELFEAGVYLDVTSSDQIEGCGGYFTDGEDTAEPILAIATGNSTWAETLMHEFSHFQQWQDGADVWTAGRLPDGTHGADLIGLWYDGLIELNAGQLDAYFQPILDVELDCEKRTVNMIRELDLPFDPALYTKQANAYLIGHSELRRRRQWFTTGVAPYRIPAILDVMPSDFETHRYSFEPLPSHLQALFDPCFT